MRFIYFIFVYFFSVLIQVEEVKSQNSSIINSYFTKEAIKQISNDLYWFKLLHYYHPGESIGQWSTRSDVISPNFFLHPQGNTDPELELQATLQAILEPVGEDPDQHVRCRFIARTKWLMSVLEFPPLEEIRCPMFERWANLEEATEMNIIFVSAYLENPASAFGHILIQFNSKNRFFNHPLLSPTLNFGAITNPEDGALEYAMRGLFGGYESGFSDERFYNFNHVYGETEQRDLWSYPLNFSKAERERITYHTWELLQHVRFTYYFFLDNCAYRMAELLEMAWTDGRRLNRPMALWAIPVYAIHNLKAMKADGEDLLGSPKLIPSRQRRLNQSVSELDDDEKQWLHRLILGEMNLEDPNFLNHEKTRQARILDAWIDYLQFKHEGKFEGETAKLRSTILLKRSKLPILEPSSETEDPPDPSLGTRPTRFRLAGVSHETMSPALELGVWTSHHDLLGDEAGHLKNAELVTLDLRLHLRDNSSHLDSLTLFSIQNLAGNPTGVPGDRSLSWRVKGGWDRQHFNCYDCLQFHLEGGLGISYSMGGHDVEYAFLDLFGKSFNHSWDTTSWGVAPHIGMLWEILDGWKIRLEGGWYRSYSGPVMDHGKALAHQRWTLSQNLDLRLEYDQIHDTREGKLALNFYW